MNPEALNILLLAGASGTAAFTITRTKVTAGFREWMKHPFGKVGTVPRAKRFAKFTGELVGCPYCVSHWLAALSVILYRPRLIHAPSSSWVYGITDVGVSGFLVVLLATPVVACINFCIRSLAPKLPPTPPVPPELPPLTYPAPTGRRAAQYSEPQVGRWVPPVKPGKAVNPTTRPAPAVSVPADTSS